MESNCGDDQFLLYQNTNSCPDLSVLFGVGAEHTLVPFYDGQIGQMEYPTIPCKQPLTSKRSTSLNSLEAEASSTTVDGFMASGKGAKGVGKIEESFGAHCHFGNTYESGILYRVPVGPGSFHKSVSSPSMSIPHVSSGVKLRTHPDASSKRHVFGRKDKRRQGNRKQNLIGNRKTMDESHLDLPESFPTLEDMLSDPIRMLLEPDITSWTNFADSDLVGNMGEKEIKRQERIYEIVLTEKHHCLVLTLMQNIFVKDMKNSGFGREAKTLFPGLTDLLEIHVQFFKYLNNKENKCRERKEVVDTVSDILVDHFSSDNSMEMTRLYGLLCSSVEKSFEVVKILRQNDTFESLVSFWSKNPLLGRKSVTDCLLLVTQRISKYPLLIEALLKTSTSEDEKIQLAAACNSAKQLNSSVNQRIDQRQKFVEFCAKVEPKTIVQDGLRRIRKDDLLLVRNRRLLFQGTGSLSRIGSGNVSELGNTIVLILSDVVLFAQDIGATTIFMCPPGIFRLNDLIMRENACSHSSLYLVKGTGSKNPEMIEIQIKFPENRNVWLEEFRNAQLRFEEERNLFYDEAEEEPYIYGEGTDLKVFKRMHEIAKKDRKILNLLKGRARLIESLKGERSLGWKINSIEGKERIVNALSEANKELERILGGEVSQSTVNRSASCVNEHVMFALGMPRRAQTFGGYDSPQRSALEEFQAGQEKTVSDSVLQLADLCGQYLKLQISSSSSSQNTTNFQRGIEELREAQKRFEVDKVQWQQEMLNNKMELDQQRMELNILKEALHKKECDIVHQREQLYRKLEKLGNQGFTPLLDSVNISPIPHHQQQPVEKVTRRPPTQPSQTTTSNNPSPRQQLPLHLASVIARTGSSNSIDFKSSKFTPTLPPPPAPNSLTESNKNPILGRGNSRLQSSQSIQQLLPLRLSESLTRRVTSQSQNPSKSPPSGTLQSLERPSRQVTNPILTHCKSAGNILSTNDPYPYESVMTRPGPINRRLHNSNTEPQIGDLLNSVSVMPIVHRRSGSTPVPMSGSSDPAWNDDSDTSRILFL